MGVGSCEFESHLGHLKGDKYYLSPFLFCCLLIHIYFHFFCFVWSKIFECKKTLYGMVIRRQPVISWLLEKNYFFDPTKISILRVENIIHQEYLLNGMRHLAQVREMNPDWGLPELLMPSFKKVMGKSEKSFSTIEPQLFQEFYREKVCGI